MDADDETTQSPITIDEGGGLVVHPPPRPGTARYRIGERIGRGGVGEVLAARDEQIGRDVAVKRLRTREPDDSAVDRFLREACIQGRLQHPAIPPVHELGRDANGLPFFVMKKVTGTTLAQILHGKAREPQHTRQRLLRAFADVCLAVEFAHVRGVIHRDLKPANIMLGAFGEVYVLDWGVAKIVGESELADVRDLRQPTVAGAVVGTITYMSPEQLAGDPELDARTDVYALGRVLAEILAIDPEIPPELEQLSIAANVTDRRQRIASARELGERVQRYLDGDRDLALRRKLAREHLEHARTAFAADDRRVAMREAGRAIALDPTLGDAAALLTRLMIEPPREIPREVQAAIDEHEIQMNQRQARAGMLLYVAFFAFIPFLVGYREGPWMPVAFVLVGAVNIAFLWYRQRVPGRPMPWFLALRNALTVALVARAFSPILIAPAVAVVITTSTLFASVYKTSRSVIWLAAAMIASVIGPWLLEAFHVISPTMQPTHDAIALLSPVAGVSATLRFIGLGFYAVFVIAASASLAHTMHQAQRVARGQLELQAWQLRQLVLTD